MFEWVLSSILHGVLEISMFDLVKRYFAKENENSKASGSRGDPGRILVAACALLLEIASIDGEFSAEEQDCILSILVNDYKLNESDAASLMEEAQAQRERSIDLWRFTNLINMNYSDEDKIRVIESVWKVIYADGRLDGHEDNLVHKLADLLGIPHSELIEAKLRAKASREADDRMNSLKKP